MQFNAKIKDLYQLRPDSESKEAGEDTEGDEEVEEGGKEEVPGGFQHQHQVGELNFFQGFCKFK